MAESEKPDSSPGKGKAKSSFLDEDMSKDFLGPWKSMSVTGGSDMDFNFEPVAKGNKKAFDFGMDMDFSLDDAFGKMPSFKLDMPDIDFSSSPKKSSKSKDKEPEGAAKGNQQKKNDKFTFSFDFNGFDDFNFDNPITKGENKATGDKNRKQASSSSEVHSGDLPRQAENTTEARREDVTYKEPPTPKVAVNSEPCFSVEQETILDASSCMSPLNTTIAVDQQKGTQTSKDVEGAVDALGRPGPDSSMAMETSSKISSTLAREHDSGSNSQSNITDMLVGSEEAYVSPERNIITTAEGIEEDIHPTESKQVFSEVGELVQSTAVPMIEVSAQAISSHEEVCSPNRELDQGSETETLREDIAAAALFSTDSKIVNSDRSSPPRLRENVNTSEERKMIVVERRGNGNSTSDTGTCSTHSIAKTMNNEVSLNTELQRSGLKDLPAQSESEATPAKSMSKRYKLSGVNNFSTMRSTNDGAGMKLVTLDRSKKGSTPLRAAGLSGGNGGKLDDNPGSLALRKQDLSLEKKEKNSDVLRDGYNKENKEIQTKIVVDVVRHDGQTKQDGSRLLDNRKMSIDVKSSGIQLPSHVPADREAKSSNQGRGELKHKTLSIETVQKSNGGQVARLSSARVDKIMPTLPSLRMSRNVTANKQSSSSIVQDTKILQNYGNVARQQVKSKMISPVNVKKQTLPMPSLKRKPTEAADLHPSKRLSPNEKSFRLPKVSARDDENEVRTQGTISEGSKKDVAAENSSPKFDFQFEANMENIGLTLMAEGDESVEKAEACAKELDAICSMLKKKHDEAKELLVRALVNNNNLLMLNHPICEEKIRQVQKFASRLISREQEAGV